MRLPGDFGLNSRSCRNRRNDRSVAREQAVGVRESRVVVGSYETGAGAQSTHRVGHRPVVEIRADPDHDDVRGSATTDQFDITEHQLGTQARTPDHICPNAARDNRRGSHRRSDNQILRISNTVPGQLLGNL